MFRILLTWGEDGILPEQKILIRKLHCGFYPLVEISSRRNFLTSIEHFRLLISNPLNYLITFQTTLQSRLLIKVSHIFIQALETSPYHDWEVIHRSFHNTYFLLLSTFWDASIWKRKSNQCEWTVSNEKYISTT